MLGHERNAERLSRHAAEIRDATPEPELTPEPEPVPVPAVPAGASAPTAAASASGAASTPPQRVWVLDGRPRYHAQDCLIIKGQAAQPMALEEALEAGFQPCSLCSR